MPEILHRPRCVENAADVRLDRRELGQPLPTREPGVDGGRELCFQFPNTGDVGRPEGVRLVERAEDADFFL